jgi:hypothetical protein
MTTFDTTTLFDDAESWRPDEVLSLDKNELIKMIGQLKSYESALQIRQAVYGLQSRLRGSDLGGLGSDASADSDNEAFVSSREYLCGQLQQIAESQTLERARHYLDRLCKSVTKVKTSKINDINLNRWKEYDDIITDSLWVLDKRDNSGVHTAGYWGNFIPQIPNQMIKRYTKKGEWILDTFAGCGTSLIESQRLGRNGIGIELQESVASRALQFVSSEPNPDGVCTDVVNDDCATVDYKAVLQRHGIESVQLLMMHPPYFDIIKFSEDSRDLSNAPSVDAFLEMMNKAVDNAASVLDRGRYFALVIGDKYAGSEWIPLGFLTMQQIMQRGFSLKSIVVKNFDDTAAKRTQKELWRYRALVGGFYIFKHEYVFLFKKN